MKILFTRRFGSAPHLACPARMSRAIAAIALLAAPAAAQNQISPDAAATALVPAGKSDPAFQQPYIDKDEWRDTPVRHRYVHGGFTGTDTRFSFYFPEKAKYQGRFFQYVTPVPDSENAAQALRPGEFGGGNIGFAIDSGGYFVETNGGGAGAAAGPGRPAEASIGAYRANAAAADYSRVVALKMYGGNRPYGYLWGGSGGGYRTLGSMENTVGVWDGAVPFVIGSPMAIPNMFTVRMYAQRVLGDKLAQVADAADVGGSGDIYAGLNAEECAALAEITRMGFPPQGWYQWKTMGMGAFPVLYPGILAADPGYFTDFWTKPGYEGFDPPKSLLDARVQHKAKVVKLITAVEANAMRLQVRPMMGEARGTAEGGWQALQGPDGNALPVALQLDSVPQKPVSGTDLLVNSGASAGKKLQMQRLDGDIVILQGGNAALAALRVGDEVQLDNSNFLAAQTYHRHQVPTAEYSVWNQFRGPDGTPLYPQRPMLLGPIFTRATSGTLNTGKFHGKMIIVENLMDIDALPWSADWYLNRAREVQGARLDGNLRLWYTERASHGGGDPTQIVSYAGVLQQALRDVAAWVEKGTPPAPTTSYRIDDGQVVVPVTAAKRRGIQPVIVARANGGERAEVAVGQAITFTAMVEVPPGTGKVVAAEWDFEGGTEPFPVKLPVSAAPRIVFSTTRSFAKPGTYFATIRVASQRDGDAATPYARVQNLARVRVVVK